MVRTWSNGIKGTTTAKYQRDQPKERGRNGVDTEELHQSIKTVPETLQQAKTTTDRHGAHHKAKQGSPISSRSAGQSVNSVNVFFRC